MMNTKRVIFGILAIGIIALSSCTSEGNDDIYDGVDKTKITKGTSVDKTKITKGTSVDKTKITKGTSVDNTKITKPGGSN